MKNLAIIPARGGSKRIPRKNIRDFLGKPVIGFSLEKAFESNLFNEIMVSTDDKEIAEVARDFGAVTPFPRSSANADDHATLNDVLHEVIGKYKAIERKFDFVCCILPTAPLLQVRFLKEGIKLMLENDFDSVRPIVKFEYPVQKAFRLNNNHVKFLDIFKPNQTARSQDYEEFYHDAGMFYWFKPSLGLEGEKRGGFQIPRIYAQDIDTEEDWEFCMLKYRYLSDKE